MTNWEDLKNSVAQVIRENGMQEITGDALQQVLNSIISNVGMNATYAGVAIASTNPGNPDGPVFYLAGTAGTYSNFGVTLAEGESAVLKLNNGAWVKDVLPFATQEQITKQNEQITELEYGEKGLSFLRNLTSSIPYIDKDVEDRVCDCISGSKADWDSYETSWDFKRHPLV